MSTIGNNCMLVSTVIVCVILVIVNHSQPLLTLHLINQCQALRLTFDILLSALTFFDEPLSTATRYIIMFCVHHQPLYTVSHSYMYKMHFVVHIYKLFSDGRGSFLALSAARHAGDPRVHYGASLAPGRAPLGVLWASKVARAGSFSMGCVPPPRAKQGHVNLNFVAATVQQQSYIKLFTSGRPRTVLLCLRVCHVSCRPRK